MILPGYNHTNHYDSHNVLLYNNIKQTFELYIRHNKNGGRAIQTSKSKDITKLNNFTEVIVNNNRGEIYCNNIMMYPEGNGYIAFSGIYLKSSNIVKRSSIFIWSSDGDNYEVVNTSPIISTCHMPVYGIVKSPDEKEFYIYFRDIENECVVCYSYVIHRIVNVTCLDKGEFITNLKNLSSHDIYVNLSVKKDGYIIVELYNEENILIQKSDPLYESSLKTKLKWVGRRMSTFIPTVVYLNSLGKEISHCRYYLRVFMANATIHSFSYDLSHAY
jgi:hypothetical protein